MKGACFWLLSFFPSIAFLCVCVCAHLLFLFWGVQTNESNRSAVKDDGKAKKRVTPQSGFTLSFPPPFPPDAPPPPASMPALAARPPVVAPSRPAGPLLPPRRRLCAAATVRVECGNAAAAPGAETRSVQAAILRAQTKPLACRGAALASAAADSLPLASLPPPPFSLPDSVHSLDTRHHTRPQRRHAAWTQPPRAPCPRGPCAAMRSAWRRARLRRSAGECVCERGRGCVSGVCVGAECARWGEAATVRSAIAFVLVAQ